MYVKKLALRNFRNYEFCSVDFSPGTNVIYGHNGIGKTNILESVYFLSYARSHRGAPENELIRFGQERADISSLISFEKSEKKLEISLFKNKKKRISVNRVAINKTSGLLDYLNVVMFCPENLRIVKGSPGERRKTVDMGLCRYGKKYFKTMYGYSSVLEQRNKLLKENPATVLKSGQCSLRLTARRFAHSVKIILTGCRSTPRRCIRISAARI